jgi:sodium-dependent dicarboxylate transporter 2/3/5
MAAIAALMAVWWMTEAIPLAATSLVPLVLMPVCKIAEPADVAASYMNDYIFLFVGGFTIALAMERWNLHRRLALHTIRLVGDRPRQLVLGFMVATAVLSMWISNTATTMMMMPIALSIILLAEEREKRTAADTGPAFAGRFGLVLMLCIAYAASIGGVATLIGTPPNVVFGTIFHKEFPGAPEIGFAPWMIMALPLSVVFLLVAWAVVCFVLHPLRGGRFLGGREIVEAEIDKLGPISRAELSVLVVFLSAAFLWMFRLEINVGPVRIPGWANALKLVEEIEGKSVKWVGDGTVAMIAALAMFFIPSGRKGGERLVDWKTVEDLPWGVLFLFGGGFALAYGFKASGLSTWIGEQCQLFGRLPVPGQVLAVSGTITFLTELTSNTATTNMVLPILAGVARAIQVNPLVLMLPATISASCAFMLPVATPPNAIVFGTGYIPIGTMVRTGIILNIIGMVLVLLLVYFVAIPFLGIDPGALPETWMAKP